MTVRPISKSAGDEFHVNPSAPGLDDLIQLNKEIAALVRAGIPLELGLKGMATTYGNQLGALTKRLSTRMSEGQSLPDALDLEGRSLPPIYGAVVKAGIASGSLPQALESLADSGALISSIRRRMALAIVYPTLCVIVAYLMGCFFLAIVLPRAIEFGEMLPRNSGMTLLAKAFEYRDYFIIGVPVLVTCAGLFLYLFRNSLSRGLWQNLNSFRWAIGSSLDWAQFMDLLALQLRHQAPLPQSFVMAADVTESRSWQAQARVVATQLTEGRSFEDALKSASLMPPAIRWMLASGERQGSLESTLRHLSDFYRRRAINRAAVIKVWLPVLITLVLTTVIGLSFGLSFFIPFRLFLQGLASE